MSASYVYVYQINGTPEYVGKGKNGRLLAHLTQGCKTYWSHRLKKSIRVGRKVECRVLPAVSEADAFEMEECLIALVGRRDLGTGPLFNRTDGGEGVSGHKQSQQQRDRASARMKGHRPTEETRQKIARANTKDPPPPFVGPQLPRYWKSPETRERMKAAALCRKPEHNKQISEANTRRWNKWRTERTEQ